MIQAHRPELSYVVRVLAKIPGEPLEDQLAALGRGDPYSNMNSASSFEQLHRLKLHRLNTVVVDEVDYLIEMVPNLLDKLKR